MEDLGNKLTSIIVNNYATFAAGILLGLFLAGIYQRFFGNSIIRKCYQDTIRDKEDTIDDYKELISERLKNVIVEPKDKGFFKRLKKFFKTKKRGKV